MSINTEKVCNRLSNTAILFAFTHSMSVFSALFQPRVVSTTRGENETIKGILSEDIYVYS